MILCPSPHCFKQHFMNNKIKYNFQCLTFFCDFHVHHCKNHKRDNKANTIAQSVYNIITSNNKANTIIPTRCNLTSIKTFFEHTNNYHFKKLVLSRNLFYSK
jgi:hypothetical protein